MRFNICCCCPEKSDEAKNARNIVSQTHEQFEPVDTNITPVVVTQPLPSENIQQGVGSSDAADIDQLDTSRTIPITELKTADKVDQVYIKSTPPIPAPRLAAQNTPNGYAMKHGSRSNHYSEDGKVYTIYLNGKPIKVEIQNPFDIRDNITMLNDKLFINGREINLEKFAANEDIVITKEEMSHMTSFEHYSDSSSSSSSESSDSSEHLRQITPDYSNRSFYTMYLNGQPIKIEIANPSEKCDIHVLNNKLIINGRDVHLENYDRKKEIIITKDQFEQLPPSMQSSSTSMDNYHGQASYTHDTHLGGTVQSSSFHFNCGRTFINGREVQLENATESDKAVFRKGMTDGMLGLQSGMLELQQGLMAMNEARANFGITIENNLMGPTRRSYAHQQQPDYSGMDEYNRYKLLIDKLSVNKSISNDLNELFGPDRQNAPITTNNGNTSMQIRDVTNEEKEKESSVRSDCSRESSVHYTKFNVNNLDPIVKANETTYEDPENYENLDCFEEKPSRDGRFIISLDECSSRKNSYYSHLAKPKRKVRKSLSPRELFNIASLNRYLILQLQCLKAHNKFRAMHNVQPLIISEHLNDVARDWAEHLAIKKAFYHRPNNKFGENLYYGGSGNYTHSMTAVKAWYDEIDLYDYNNPGFCKETGHFTQLIWKDTQELGTGVAIVGNETWVVCNYHPPGNVTGKFNDIYVPRPRN